jgi:hypothetical protein
MCRGRCRNALFTNKVDVGGWETMKAFVAWLAARANGIARNRTEGAPRAQRECGSVSVLRRLDARCAGDAVMRKALSCRASVGLFGKER